MFIGRLWKRFFLVLAVCLGLLGLNGLINDLARLARWRFYLAGVIWPRGLWLVGGLFLRGIEIEKVANESEARKPIQ